jgi:hypothetical protein
LNRLRNRQVGVVSSLSKHLGVLLRIERVTPRASEQIGLRFGGQKGRLEQTCQESARVRFREWCKRESCRVELPSAPGRPPLEKLRSSRANDQDRDAAGPLDEMVDEVQQVVIGPVQILEDEDEWSMLGHPLEEPPPSRKRLVPPVCGLLVLASRSHERAQLRLDPRSFTRLANQP